MLLRFRYHQNSVDLHEIFTKTNARFSILLSRKWQDSWRSAVRESASALSRFPDSKDLKSKSKTSLGSDYSKSSEPHTFLVHIKLIFPSSIFVFKVCVPMMVWDQILLKKPHLFQMINFMSRNGGKKRRKKMPLSRFSNWRFNKSLLLDNRKNPLNLIKYQIFFMWQ